MLAGMVSPGSPKVRVAPRRLGWAPRSSPKVAAAPRRSPKVLDHMSPSPKVRPNPASLEAQTNTPVSAHPFLLSKFANASSHSQCSCLGRIYAHKRHRAESRAAVGTEHTGMESHAKQEAKNHLKTQLKKKRTKWTTNYSLCLQHACAFCWGLQGLKQGLADPGKSLFCSL